MRSTASERDNVAERDDVAEWDVARPERPIQVPGVSMAGFQIRELDALRMIPHPAVTLALEFGPGQPVVDDATGHRHRGSLVAGLGFGGGVLVHGENVACVQVRLSPVVAQAILGVSPADLDGFVVSLDDLWGREATQIRERLGDTPSWEERFSLTNALLTRRYEAGSSIDPEVAWAWRRITTSHGLVRIDGLATELGWSRKRLWSRFLSQIGLPPKRTAKLVRFDHATHRLVAGQSAAQVAADTGYADQSHLHRDIVTTAGVTPAVVAGEPWLTVDDVAWPDHGTPA